MEILEIIEKLNPWWSKKEFESGIDRPLYLEKIKTYLGSKEIVILTGVRRAGKTTLLSQTIKFLIENKKVDPRQILFVNFDEADIATMNKPIKTVLDTYFQEINSDKPAYLIFDEIQNIKGWERWAKSIYDEKQSRLIISGSFSHLLDNKLATLISGRYLKVKVFPLDFNEFLDFNELELNNKLDIVSNKNRIIKCLKKYLIDGGFPRITLQQDNNLKREQLKTYYESIVYKDILLMHEVRNSKLMKELIYYLMSNFTSSYSYKKLGNLLKLDFSTLKEYFSYLEESKILFELSIFSYSLKVQSRNNKKIYCIDNGLRNAVSFQFSKDEGRLAENLVFIDLIRKDKEVYYWKDNNEVDFVTKNRDNSLTAINVSYTNEIDEREVKGLLEFEGKFDKCKKMILLTRDIEKIEKGVNFIPLWKWLLNK